MLKIIEPLITPEFVKCTYQYIVLEQLKKTIEDIENDYRDGTQDGYIDCLSRLFNNSDEEHADVGVAMTEIAGKILSLINNQLGLEQLKEKNLGSDEIDAIETKANAITQDYVKQNYRHCLDAIRKI